MGSDRVAGASQSSDDSFIIRKKSFACIPEAVVAGGEDVRIGAFEIIEPVPDLNEPVAFVILKPWIDVNHVGSLVLSGLEMEFKAKELGRLAKPGHFFDFTRYRPTLSLEKGKRRVSIPNTVVRYAKREKGSDLLFINLLEPHALSEFYVDSVLKLLKAFKVKKYCLLGSMYADVPHTRPLIVYGGAQGKEAEIDFDQSGAHPSDYQGPTTIAFLITQAAPEFGIETLWFIVSLPQYVRLEEDYLGKLRLMEILNLLYPIPIDEKDYEKAAEQRRLINEQVERTPELKKLLPQLEGLYEVLMKKKGVGKKSKLSHAIEEILWNVNGKDFGKA